VSILTASFVHDLWKAVLGSEPVVDTLLLRSEPVVDTLLLRSEPVVDTLLLRSEPVVQTHSSAQIGTCTHSSFLHRSEPVHTLLLRSHPKEPVNTDAYSPLLRSHSKETISISPQNLFKSCPKEAVGYTTKEL